MGWLEVSRSDVDVVLRVIECKRGIDLSQKKKIPAEASACIEDVTLRAGMLKCLISLDLISMEDHEKLVKQLSDEMNEYKKKIQRASLPFGRRC